MDRKSKLVKAYITETGKDADKYRTLFEDATVEQLKVYLCDTHLKAKEMLIELCIYQVGVDVGYTNDVDDLSVLIDSVYTLDELIDMELED